MEDVKTWYQSRTIWGAIIAILASLAHAGGYNLTVADQGQLAEAALSLAGAFGGLVAIWGRMKASVRVG